MNASGRVPAVKVEVSGGWRRRPTWYGFRAAADRGQHQHRQQRNQPAPGSTAQLPPGLDEQPHDHTASNTQPKAKPSSTLPKPYDEPDPAQPGST
jgi:hypothetical protein